MMLRANTFSFIMGGLVFLAAGLVVAEFRTIYVDKFSPVAPLPIPAFINGAVYQSGGKAPKSGGVHLYYPKMDRDAWGAPRVRFVITNNTAIELGYWEVRCRGYNARGVIVDAPYTNGIGLEAAKSEAGTINFRADEAMKTYDCQPTRMDWREPTQVRP